MKRGWLIWLVLSAALALVAQSLVSIVGMETDFWWHLSAGQRIFEHGLELKDPYSFTYPGQDWIRVDWLFQVGSYLVYALGGLSGLLLVRSLLFLLAGWVLALTLFRGGLSPARCWPVVLLTSSIWSESVALRPATVSILGTVVLVFLLEELRRGRQRLAWVIPVFLAFWFNIHVAALAGCLIIGLYAVAEYPASRARHWLWLPPVSFLALFLNPQGWRTVYLPIHFLLVKSPWNQIILEVLPPHWDWPGTLACRLLLLLALFSAALEARQRRFLPLLVAVVFGTLMSRTYRHQFQFCALLACQAVPFLRALPMPRLARPLLLGLSLLWAARSLLLITHTGLPLSGLYRRESFAEQVCQLVCEGPPGLRLFTDMNSAGYYMWKSGARQQVFIDSRTSQVYMDDNFVGAYFEILLGRAHAMELLDRFQVQAIAHNRLSVGDSPLFTQLLPASPDWVLLYSDQTGQFFCRKTLAGKFPALKSAEYLQLYSQALQLQREGRLDQAEALLQQCLTLYPQFASAHQHLAQIWMGQARWGPARRALAQAELENPQTVGLDEDWARLGLPCPDRGWLHNLLLPFLLL